MYLSRRFVVLPLIIITLVAFFYLDATSLTTAAQFGLLFVTSLITAMLLRWVELGRTTSLAERRQRKLNKMLTRMNDDDLDFLRERLSDQTHDDGEYASLEALLQQKQKRST